MRRDVHTWGFYPERVAMPDSVIIVLLVLVVLFAPFVIGWAKDADEADNDR